MPQTCHPLPPSIAEEMLQTAARAMCDQPSETDAQRDARTRQMVHLTRGMQPRDGLEYMLAILAAGHFNLILHSMREVFQDQPDANHARAKSTIVALDRHLLGFVRELRVSRKRPSADPAEEARPKEASQPPSPTSSPQSHRRIVDRPLPVPMTNQTGKAAGAFAASAATPMPLPPVAPSQPTMNILRHPQPGPADQYLAEFERELAAAAEKLETAHAREKELATA
jgi:hypothetical protein